MWKRAKRAKKMNLAMLAGVQESCPELRADNEKSEREAELIEVERAAQGARMGAAEARGVRLVNPVSLPPNSERAVLVTLVGLPEGAYGAYVVEATTLPQWRART